MLFNCLPQLPCPCHVFGGRMAGTNFFSRIENSFTIGVLCLAQHFAAFIFLLSCNFSDFERTKIMCRFVHHQEKATYNENSELNQKCTPNVFSICCVSLRTRKKNFDIRFLRCYKNTNVDSSRARQNQHLFSDLQLGLLCRKVKVGDKKTH